ncbi:MAG: SHOCT domain-containing protein [Bradyrhizobium sp.]|jgi:putative membrane protein
MQLKFARPEKRKKSAAFSKMGDLSMWKKLSVLLIPIALVAAQPLQVLAQQSQSPNTPQPPQWYGPGPWHMWSDGYGWHLWWMFPAMMLFMVLTCAVVVYFLFSRLSGGAHQPGSRDRQWDTGYSALGILDERYARGEIQKEEYQERKAAILSGRLR